GYIAVMEYTVNDIWKMAEIVSRSRMYDATPEQMFTLMMLAQASGRHPFKGLERYHIIHGRPAKKTNAMLSDFLAFGGSLKWIKYEDDICAAEFAYKDNKIVVEWTIERAKKAGLLGRKASLWSIYPRQMLKARVISEGITATFPEVMEGLYTPEEAQDIRVMTQKDARKDARQEDSYSERALAKLSNSVENCKTSEELKEIEKNLVSIKNKLKEED
ncbi:MAG: hypothetical protein CUN55_17100, partial [Phototrophicales bacterium]